MRIQVVTYVGENPSNVVDFLKYGKKEGSRCRGNYKLKCEEEFEREKSIAATIFLGKDTVVLVHWHIVNNLTIEDESIETLTDELNSLEKASLLFQALLKTSSGKARRVCVTTLL